MGDGALVVSVHKLGTGRRMTSSPEIGAIVWSNSSRSVGGDSAFFTVEFTSTVDVDDDDDDDD